MLTHKGRNCDGDIAEDLEANEDPAISLGRVWRDRYDEKHSILWLFVHEC